MTTTEIRTVTRRATTWMGREGVPTVLHLDSKADGKRISIIRWTDGGANVKAIKGDGRYKDFVCYEEVEIADASQADGTAATMISKYFA